MAQLIMCLVFGIQTQEPEFSFLADTNKLAMAASVYNPHRGSGDRKIPVALWPASSAQIEESKFSISKRKAESN